MYRIGQFSKIGKVTVKALRFYEEEGLLEPCHIDSGTGYRYYDSRQLPRIHKIVALRQCGFSIPEIQQIVNGKNVAELFASRKKELEVEVAQAGERLASINSYIESLGQGEDMRYHVVVKDLPRVVVYGMRTIVESYESYFDLMPKIGEEIAAYNHGRRCLRAPQGSLLGAARCLRGGLQMDRRQRLCPFGQPARILYRRDMEQTGSCRMAHRSAGADRAGALPELALAPLPVAQHGPAVEDCRESEKGAQRLQ
jgi:DNA-binding transcriptional MerR regulator